ncbi:hypothetical protein COT48_03395 [Candidatus Woesearchaeota archaeon CG08_land_8_20_14_0_20_47_9]|nr:MAG: hypothetical protein COV22_01780 [Candidatus Woesearchaeota archaeon CG10_big_fil_rev_8_21_14_0_10_47_5]PIO03800.1 MAG: hypothetical protein COT48_03395 [Candidatus Woesearchaeota archaeon CG08_land_8_20_14_0_20_47_9]HII29473.1 hypothetical protein [Candidatus Woesearchaeota archaeon]
MRYDHLLTAALVVITIASIYSYISYTREDILAMSLDNVSCAAQGGKWGQFGLSLEERCNLPTSDAGKVCSNSVESREVCVD